MTTTTKEQKLALLYFEITDLWKKFCEEHSDLFNVTCDEYSLLLNSELDLLNEKILEKESIIKRISHLEVIRREIISEINSLYPEKNIDSVSKLLTFMTNYEIEKKRKTSI